MTNRPMLRFDHIAIFARTLTEGAAHVRRALGIEMPKGGAHPRMGTHNLLLSLGNDSFLEVIAIDPDAAAPQRPRWFRLDQFDAEPMLGTWILGTDDLRAEFGPEQIAAQTTELAPLPPDCGRITEMTRGALTWLLTIPDDGSLPMGGAFPTLIEWPAGPHPASGMVDLGCRLRALTVEHPQADLIAAQIGDRIDQSRITLRPAARFALHAEIETPDGLRHLS